MRSGTASPDPGEKRVEKIEKEISACKRRLEALEVALDDAEDDLLAQVDEHRDEWASEVEAELEEAREEYAKAVESLSVVRHKVSAKYALLRFVRLFPEEETSYRIRGSYVASLKAPHGEPYLFDAVIQALTQDAQARPEVQRTISDTQRLHEERLANERAGKSYYTDEELNRRAQNPVEFAGGQGAKLIRQMPITPVNVDTGDEVVPDRLTQIKEKLKNK